MIKRGQNCSIPRDDAPARADAAVRGRAQAPSGCEALFARLRYGTGAPVNEFQLVALPSSTAGVPFLSGTLTRAVVFPLGPAVPEQVPPLSLETV